MSAVPRSDRAALLARELQCLLVGAHGVAQTTLRDPDVGQGDGAADESETCPARCTLAIPSA